MARNYAMRLDRDLFGAWIVEIQNGRIGARGRIRPLAFETEAGARAEIYHRLKRRSGAPAVLDADLARGDPAEFQYADAIVLDSYLTDIKCEHWEKKGSGLTNEYNIWAMIELPQLGRRDPVFTKVETPFEDTVSELQNWSVRWRWAKSRRGQNFFISNLSYNFPGFPHKTTALDDYTWLDETTPIY